MAEGQTWWGRDPVRSPRQQPPPGRASTVPSLTRQQVRAVICATFLSELATILITNVTFSADADIQHHVCVRDKFDAIC